MTKNPFVNASVALLYIIAIAMMMFYGPKNAGGDNSVLAPIAAISLFTFSAAVMGYLFCYQPIQLYFDGKKKIAVKLFLQTTGVFGAFTFIILFLFFSGLIR